MHKKILISISFLAIFCLAILVWYSPIIFKNHTSVPTASDALARAKNFALTNQYAAENDLNIILASDLISEQAHESMYGNKLGTILYGYILKIFPTSNNNTIVLINCFILALACLIFSFIIYYLFNFKTAIFFALIYIFLPSNWLLPQTLVGYEFALLFLSLFFLFFSLGTKKFQKNIKIKFWLNGASLMLSGVFLTLACLSREAFLILLPILFLFLFFTKLKKYLIYIFIPVILILAIYWLPSFTTGQNTYLLFFTNKTQEKLKASDYAYYAHIFPDPYTYHFSHDEYLQNYSNLKSLDTMQGLGKQKVLVNMGQTKINFWQRIKVGTPLLTRHIFRFFSITEIGGPLIFLFFWLGLLVLKKQNTYWYKFYLSWLIGSFILLAYFNLAGRNHIMDWGWVIALCSALGLIYLNNVINKNKITQILLLVLVIYNLILCSHVLFGQIYDNSPMPLLSAYTQKIKDSEIKSNEVIAIPFRAEMAYNLNFTTDKSIVIFQNKTIEKLLAENKIVQAFEKFNVKYILGYTPELTEEILKNNINIKSIADSSLSIEQEYQGINNKNWLMNLVK